ncbi:unnamed protein product [Thlaspi arvense]|uniref:FBD domain-containing protein n=1 Tax=Thlaspi arvense TaxID=13288 RepID=A0AAU9SJB0_THLAR|nr:unnamed protein product [Thlaspi arvense]
MCERFATLLEPATSSRDLKGDVTLVLLFPNRGFALPRSIFKYAQTLIKLKLGCGKICGFCALTRGDIIFTRLTTLHLDSVDLGRNGANLALILSKCPVLEELIVNCIRFDRWISDASVSSQTLKRLTIDGGEFIPPESSRQTLTMLKESGSGEPQLLPDKSSCVEPAHVSFDTPNLVYLNYAHVLARSYPLVKLDSLVEARLDVGSTRHQMRARDSSGGHEVGYDATNLVMGIHNVQTLHLTSDTIEVFGDFCKTVPVFHILKHLSIESDHERTWQALPLLLINCPTLHTLVFHGLHHRVTDGCGDACACITFPSSSSCLSSCPVKILKILDFAATCGEMSLVKHFMKKCPLLEEVTIVLDFDSTLEEDLDLFEVYEALEMAPRASPNCKFEVLS